MGSSAIVVGGSMAGLLAARALSEHVDSVVVLERDDHTDGGAHRGVPQGRHGHALLAGGERLLCEWFPGLAEELIADGAVRTSGEDVTWFNQGGYVIRGDWGVQGLAMTRPFLEDHVRRRVAALPGVDLRLGVGVDGLSIAGGAVRGVTVGDAGQTADLVVDCSGRRAPLLGDLERGLTGTVATSTVEAMVTYRTLLLERRPGDAPFDWAMVSDFPHTTRAGVVLPVEGDRWQMVLASMYDDRPPRDIPGLIAFARTLSSPELADLLERAPVLSPPVAYSLPSSQRRHFELIPARHRPRGYVAVGDAVCSFNPLYGQGMTSAAMQAHELARIVASNGIGAPDLPAIYFRRAARVVSGPWSIATGSAFADARTVGHKPRGTDLINRYVTSLAHAGHTSLPVHRQFVAVQNLLAPTWTLMTPAMLARVAIGARRSPARSRVVRPRG